MKKPLLLLLVAASLVAAVAFSGAGRVEPPRPDLVIERGERNPFSHLRLGLQDGDFQFAIVSDRTGGHRPKIFSQAVAKLNLLQPAFVMSVGDLIEGSPKKETLASQWKEFDSYVGKLTMPFFYVSGNHDVGNPDSDKFWKEKLGRRNYSFVYRDVLFVALNSDDPPGSGKIGKEQHAWLKTTLAENAKARWTLVFVHRPVWNADVAKNGWLDVETALADRPYTVICGHLHRFKKYVRQGRAYYQLATTGGSSRGRGIDYGEFDHITWVTMKKDGPVLAHIMLDAILTDDLRPIDSDELGVTTKRPPTHVVYGKAMFEGAPIPGALVVLEPKMAATGARRPEGKVTFDGSFTLSTFAADDGAYEGEFTVTVVWPDPLAAAGKASNLLPARYAKAETSGLTVNIRPGPNLLKLELKR